ncbi:MAG: chorismate mutase [Lachnospiraceae bacterium]|nr:chorismate mutase [Lachnospiraceae bacterium]
MRSLDEIRVDIDAIDQKIQESLMQRLNCSEEVVHAKIRDRNFVINRPERESAILEQLGKDVPDDRRDCYLAIVRKITETSRMYQYGILFEQVPELFQDIAKGVDCSESSETVTVQLKRPNIPNAMSAILSMIGDYGFDMERLQLLGYSEDHTAASFELMIHGDISRTHMQKLLLQLSMETDDFHIMAVS